MPDPIPHVPEPGDESKIESKPALNPAELREAQEATEAYQLTTSLMGRVLDAAGLDKDNPNIVGVNIAGVRIGKTDMADRYGVSQPNSGFGKNMFFISGDAKYLNGQRPGSRLSTRGNTMMGNKYGTEDEQARARELIERLRELSSRDIEATIELKPIIAKLEKAQ